MKNILTANLYLRNVSKKLFLLLTVGYVQDILIKSK